MKVIRKTSMERVEAALGSAYRTITHGVFAEERQVGVSAFYELSACFADIAVELGIDLIAAAEKARRATE